MGNVGYTARKDRRTLKYNVYNINQKGISMSNLLTMEEIFNLQPGMGGLHNLLNLHTAFIDEQGVFTLKLTITEQLLNPKGNVHGGTLFALCDSAVGAYIAFQHQWAVTVDSTIHFFRPALCGDNLIARVFERKKGHTISTFSVEVYNGKNQNIADATFTMYYTKER